MTSFISRMNTWEDGYGGPLDRRLRLLLEVFAAVRASVQLDFIVGCRFLAEECIDGGNQLDETPAVGVAFDRGNGFRFEFAWRKVRGRGPPGRHAAAYPYIGQSGYECMSQFISDARGLFGRSAAPTRAIRNASWGGVWHAGRLHGWRAQLRNGGELARGGSLRRRRRSAVVPRRSRRDAKDLARPRRGSAHLRVHELLRGARSKTLRWLPANSGTSSTSTLLTHCSRRKENDGLSCWIGRCQSK